MKRPVQEATQQQGVPRMQCKIISYQVPFLACLHTSTRTTTVPSIVLPLPRLPRPIRLSPHIPCLTLCSSRYSNTFLIVPSLSRQPQADHLLMQLRQTHAPHHMAPQEVGTEPASCREHCKPCCRLRGLWELHGCSPCLVVLSPFSLSLESPGTNVRCLSIRLKSCESYAFAPCLRWLLDAYVQALKLRLSLRKSSLTPTTSVLCERRNPPYSTVSFDHVNAH